MISSSINDLKNLKNVTAGYMIDINDKQMDLFKRFCKILIDWNKKINLISRKEENIIEKHFLDSILFLPEMDNLARRLGPGIQPSVLDIGSGGGFPAISLAIMKPDWKFTLCESIKKKVNFLNHVINELDLRNADVINARVETLPMTPLRYDFVTARAVARLDELIKYSMPLLKKDGCLLAYKSKSIENEIKGIKNVQIFSKEINEIGRKLIVVQM